MTIRFDEQLAKQHLHGNVVLKINGVYYSQHKVDAGLSMDADKIGVVKAVNVSGTRIDLRKVKTSIPRLTFSLTDEDDTISNAIGVDSQSWLNYQVDFYFGFRTSSFHWNNYKLLGTSFIRKLNKIQNGFSFTCAPPQDELQSSIYNTYTTLDGDHNDSINTIDLINAASFPSASASIYLIKINNEFLTWTGKTSNQLTGVSRAALGSTAMEHEDGDRVHLVTKIKDHSMNLLLDIIKTQVGISTSLVDDASFEALRDDELSLDGDHTYYMYDINNALNFIQDNILLATNTRLINKNVDNVHKISISLLDQVAFATDANSITEDHSKSNPKYDIAMEKIINQLIIQYDYTYGTDKYATTRVFDDSDSIALFGTKTLTMKLKGIITAENGFNTVTTMSTRLLRRLSTPSAEIKVQTLFNRNAIEIADQVFLENRFLPQSGTGEIFNNMLEVISKSVSGFIDNAIITFVLAFTSYRGYRYGLISPSPLITSVISQKIFFIPQSDADLLEAGFFLKLWQDDPGNFYADAKNEIESIANNQITMKNNFNTSLTTSIRIVFPDYDDSSDKQRSKFGYVSPNTNLFADDTKAYEIIF